MFVSSNRRRTVAVEYSVSRCQLAKKQEAQSVIEIRAGQYDPGELASFGPRSAVVSPSSLQSGSGDREKLRAETSAGHRR